MDNYHSTKKNLLAITPGEPAGIGPDIVLQLADQEGLPDCIVIADPELLKERASRLNLPIVIHCVESNQPFEVTRGQLAVLPIQLATPCVPGRLDPLNAPYVLETLKVAGEGCLKGEFAGLVTGPVHKGVINDAGIPFSGHTQFLADLAGVSDVVMMLSGNALRVALVTTHIPLAEVPKTITQSLLEKTLRILQSELKVKFRIANPHIFVCGLNPHAGEGGYLGREEMDIIIPVINQLKAEGFNVEGPFSADTIFSPKHLEIADVILAMYHDQGLPVLKYAAFGNAVNITLGLPFIRTSVDHGTALHLAGTGRAEVGSLKAAIGCAKTLIPDPSLPRGEGSPIESFRRGAKKGSKL